MRLKAQNTGGGGGSGGGGRTAASVKSPAQKTTQYKERSAVNFRKRAVCRFFQPISAKCEKQAVYIIQVSHAASYDL
jgi:hypothetical protein